MLSPSTYHCPHNHSLLSLPLTPCCVRAHVLDTYTSAWGRVLSSLAPMWLWPLPLYNSPPSGFWDSLCHSGICSDNQCLPPREDILVHFQHSGPYCDSQETWKLSASDKPANIAKMDWELRLFALLAPSEPALWQYACDGHSEEAHVLYGCILQSRPKNLLSFGYGQVSVMFLVFMCFFSKRVSGAVFQDLVWEGQRQQLQATLHFHSISLNPNLWPKRVFLLFSEPCYTLSTLHLIAKLQVWNSMSSWCQKPKNLTFYYTWLYPSQKVSFHLSCKARVLSNSLDRDEMAQKVCEQWNTYDLLVHTLTDCPCISLPYCLKNST